MEDVSITVTELERGFYWMFCSVYRMCSKNGNSKGRILSSNIIGKLEVLPPFPQSRKPQA